MRICARSFWGLGPEWTRVAGYLRMAENSEDLEEGTITRWARPRLSIDAEFLLCLISAMWSSTIVSDTLEILWWKWLVLPRIIVFPLKITGKSRSSYRVWFWPKVCYSGHTLHSLTSTQLFSLFSCLWSEEALKTWRKGKGTLDGRDLGPEMACKMRPYPKQSVNREHTFIVMNHWSVIENKLTWLIQIYFLSIMKASNDTCCRYCKYQKKRRLYRKSLERQHQSFSSSSE